MERRAAPVRGWSYDDEPGPIFSPEVVQMESDGTRANVGVIRPVPTGMGTARQVTARPDRDTTAPPKGGGNTPTPSGSGKPPGGRGLLRHPSLPQGFASAASDISATGLPNGDGGLVVKRYRRRVVHRTTNFDSVVRLVAELLFKISRIGKGSVVYLNSRKMRVLLGLDAPIHPIDLSVVYEVLSRLGFEVVEASRGKAVMIDVRHPLIEEIRNAENINDVIQVIRKHLGE